MWWLNPPPRWSILPLASNTQHAVNALTSAISRSKTRETLLMSNESVPPELLEVRDKIDAIDTKLGELRAERFKLTHQVGLLKASQALSSVDAQREAEKLARLSELCEAQGLNPELVTELFSRIMREVVSNHEKLRQQQ